jgi:hypothetical protein
MAQKTPFIAADRRDRLSMTELCECYGVSRQTGYKGLDRSLTHGPQGLDERRGGQPRVHARVHSMRAAHAPPPR